MCYSTAESLANTQAKKMTEKDTLQRFIFEKAPVRGEYIQLNDTFQTIIHQQPYPAPIRQILGEALCAAGLLSAIIKFTGRLTVQFRGKGKLKLLLAQCDNHFKMRGLVKWEGEAISHEELMQAFTEGVLVIMLDSGTNKQRYQGIVSWQGDSLASSIEGYFKDSEQLATKVWLAVDDTKATGFLLQVVPLPDKEARGIEKEIVMPHWEHFSYLSSNLKLEDMLKIDYKSLLTSTFPDDEIRLFPSHAIEFHCPCTRKRGEDAIKVLGQEEAEAEIKDKQSIVVTCEFCNKEYVFDRADVTNIFDGKQLH
jgi:molecular chaperone Hsp33